MYGTRFLFADCPRTSKGDDTGCGYYCVGVLSDEMFPTKPVSLWDGVREWDWTTTFVSTCPVIHGTPLPKMYFCGSFCQL